MSNLPSWPLSYWVTFKYSITYRSFLSLFIYHVMNRYMSRNMLMWDIANYSTGVFWSAWHFLGGELPRTIADEGWTHLCHIWAFSGKANFDVFFLSSHSDFFFQGQKPWFEPRPDWKSEGTSVQCHPWLLSISVEKPNEARPKQRFNLRRAYLKKSKYRTVIVATSVLENLVLLTFWVADGVLQIRSQADPLAGVQQRSY